MTKKLPEITLSDWLEAEQKSKTAHHKPQPKGSKTVEQYAEDKGLSPITCRQILVGMYRNGFARREKWLRPTGTMSYVYFLK